MIKDPIVDMDNRFNEVFSSFDSLNPEFAPGCRIIDIFSSHFSFHFFNKHSDNSFLSHSHQLDNLAIMSLEDPLHALIITNASIKNNMATSITYIYICNRFIIKTLHYTVNINSTEAKLFIIRYGINQATNSIGILKIIVVTDLIHSAKRIFDLSLYSFQIHVAFILCKLQNFFMLN